MNRITTDTIVSTITIIADSRESGNIACLSKIVISYESVVIPAQHATAHISIELDTPQVRLLRAFLNQSITNIVCTNCYKEFYLSTDGYNYYKTLIVDNSKYYVQCPWCQYREKL